MTTSRSYDSHGNVASETAPNGRVTTYLYDDADRLVQRIDNYVAGTPAVNEDISTYYAYDDAGRQSAVRTPTADRDSFSVTRYMYNDQGQLATEIRNCTDSGTNPPGDPAWKTCAGSGTRDADTNLVTTNAYDDRGNRVSGTQPDPSATSGTSTSTVTTRYAFDDQNRLCGVLENATENLASPDPCVAPGGGSDTQNVWTSYGYDALGNLVSMTDGEGHTTSYTYDGAGRMRSLTDALGNTTTYGYDDLGRRTSQSARGTGQQSNLVTWAYDAAGRLASRTTADGTTSYQYDDNGNQTSASATGSTIATTYDRLNRPLTVSVSGDSSATTSYTFSRDSPAWSDPSGAYTASLDAFGRQIALTDPVHATAWTRSYRSDGQPATIAAPNGNTTAFTYDDAGTPASTSTTNNGGLNVGYAWTRNRAGNILSETGQVLVHSVPTADPINVTTSYGYDPLGRLSNFTRAGSTTSYGWQAVPNRVSVQVDLNDPVTYTFDAANRETMSSLGDITYNTEGQLVARPGQTLTWNELGQLTQVKDTATQATIARYSYDALDRLLTVTHAGDVRRFRYVGLATNVAQIVNDADNSVVYSIANDWNGDRLFQWTGSSEAFYGANSHHDVTWTADANGAVSATLLYDSWGNLVASSGTSLPDFGFQGSWFDVATNLSWAVTRWYSADLGRFISEDPFPAQRSEPASANQYAYAAGEPVNRADPLGLMWDTSDPHPANAASGYWIWVGPGESTRRLAYEYLGSSDRWPIIYNRNRFVFGRSPDSHVAIGQCVYIEPHIAPVPSHPSRCGSHGLHAPVTGQPPRSDTLQAISTSGLGSESLYSWLMLTRQNLVARTDERFRELSRLGRQHDPGFFESFYYKGNLAAADTIAVDIMNNFKITLGSRVVIPTGCGGYVWRSDPDSHQEYVIGSCLPPSGHGINALTIGHYVFLPSRDVPSLAIRSHEYIHTLQYQTSAGGSLATYLVEYLLGKEGTARNRLESYPYVWESWMLAYSRWEPAPWQIWHPL